jgi:hypothetical protein
MIYRGHGNCTLGLIAVTVVNSPSINESFLSRGGFLANKKCAAIPSAEGWSPAVSKPLNVTREVRTPQE